MFECFYTSLVGPKKSKSHENEMFRFLVKHAVKCCMLHLQTLMKLLVNLKWRFQKSQSGNRKKTIANRKTVNCRQTATAQRESSSSATQRKTIRQMEASLVSGLTVLTQSPLSIRRCCGSCIPYIINNIHGR